MNPETQANEDDAGTGAAEARRKPQMRNWRSSAGRVRLDKGEAARQGEITHLAFGLLGGRDAALGFLNGEDAGLGGRPLDIAMASREGFVVVEQAIRVLAGRG